MKWFKKRPSWGAFAEITEQLAAEMRMNERLWEAVFKWQDQLLVVERDVETAAGWLRRAEEKMVYERDRADQLQEDLDAVQALWHPPTLEEAFTFAENMLNPDYKPIPRSIDWAVPRLYSSLPDVHGEVPPLDGISVGSMGEGEDLPIPIRHGGPGL